MSIETEKNFRLLNVHGATVKITGLNYIWGSDVPFLGVRIQMSKSINGFHPGPEIPLDHLNALIGHLQDLRDQLKNQDVIPEKAEKNWNISDTSNNVECHGCV